MRPKFHTQVPTLMDFKFSSLATSIILYGCIHNFFNFQHQSNVNSAFLILSFKVKISDKLHRSLTNTESKNKPLYLSGYL